MAKAVERSLQAIGQLCESPSTVAELAASMNMNRASTYRLVQSLEEDGWVAASGSPKRYHPTFRTAELGIAFLNSRRERTIILPFLFEAAQSLRKPTLLGFYEDGTTVFTDAVEPFGERLISRLVGSRVIAGQNATSKALLAYQAPDEIERVVARGIPKSTQKGPSTREEILRDLELTRERGFARNEEEHTPGVAGIAVPVFGRSGVAAGIGFVLGTSMPDDGYVDEVANYAKELASRATMAVGGQPRHRVLLA